MSVDEYRGPYEVWAIATPLPLQLLLHDRCSCGRSFWGHGRRARYEQHWQLDHATSDSDALQRVVVRRDR